MSPDKVVGALEKIMKGRNVNMVVKKRKRNIIALLTLVMCSRDIGGGCSSNYKYVQ